MAGRMASLLVTILIGLLVLAPVDMVGADPDSGFTVDLHEIDIVQLTNGTVFFVIEKAFYNNTGNSEFNETLRSWLPVNSVVLSMACPSPSSMVMRRVNATDYRCHEFSREGADENIITFNAFEENETLSYYGQNVSLILNGSNGNGSVWHSIPINLTVGWESLSRSSASQGQGLEINASEERMDARQPSAIQRAISTSQLINVTNRSVLNETISFSVDGLPAGWEARIRNGSSEISALSLEPNETESLTLVVELPPHRMFMEFIYLLYIEPATSPRMSVTYEQNFTYNVTEYSLWLFSLKDADVSVTGDYVHVPRPVWILPEYLHSIEFFDPKWSESKADFHEILGAPSAGESLQIVIEWEKDVEEGVPLWLVGSLALLVVIIAVLAFLWIRGRKSEDEESEEEPIREKETGVRKEEIAESLREAHAAYSAGHISEEFYKDLKSRYEIEVEKSMAEEDPELAALKGEKQKLLMAIKNLQQRLDAGEISEGGYQRLVKDYKEKAIQIMKEIDRRTD